MGASAQSAEVAPKAIRPVTNIRRRPNWSPSEPPTRSSETSVSSVGLDHPLLPGEAGVEVVADRRQRDVDHGRVEEDDGRAEDRRDQGQALLAGHAVESTWGPRPARAAAAPG